MQVLYCPMMSTYSHIYNTDISRDSNSFYIQQTNVEPNVCFCSIFCVVSCNSFIIENLLQTKLQLTYLLNLSFCAFLSLSASAAAFNFACDTQSLPTRRSRVTTAGSDSYLACSNSFLALIFKISLLDSNYEHDSSYMTNYHSSPFSFRQLKCRVVRKISRYRDKASEFSRFTPDIEISYFTLRSV